jgi:hypothetical protein
MEKYNKICNKYFTTYINNQYNITFNDFTDFNDSNDINKNNNNIISLLLNNNLIWAKYKILCSYDINMNFLKLGTDMIIIEKSMIDININNILKKKYDLILNINDLEKCIMDNIFEYNYIGFVLNKKNSIYFYYLIEEIIRI